MYNQMKFDYAELSQSNFYRQKSQNQNDSYLSNQNRQFSNKSLSNINLDSDFAKLRNKNSYQIPYSYQHNNDYQFLNYNGDVQVLRNTMDSKFSISQLLKKQFYLDSTYVQKPSQRLYESYIYPNQSYQVKKINQKYLDSNKLYQSFVSKPRQQYSFQNEIKKNYQTISVSNRKFRSPQKYQLNYSQNSYQKWGQRKILQKMYSPQRVNQIIVKLNKLKSSQIQNQRKQLWKKYDNYVKPQIKNSKFQFNSTNNNSELQRSLQSSHSATFLTDKSKYSFQRNPNEGRQNHFGNFRKKQNPISNTHTPKYSKKYEQIQLSKRYTNLPKTQQFNIISNRIEKKKIQNNVKILNIQDFYVGPTKGSGKFGSVHIVFHKYTGTIYALKKIPKQLIKNHKLQQQLIKQIKLQSYFNHSNILKLYTFFDDQNYIYLLLEYMQQGTLFDFMNNKKGKIPQKIVSVKILEITMALSYLHDMQIAHRDIKPQNIVLSFGVAKLCDFGWATRCSDRRKTFCGTLDYISPDILQLKQYDYKVDLWCLGVLTYQLLIGKVPFYHNSKKQTTRRILNIDKQKLKYGDDISIDGKDFIECLLKKEAQQRKQANQLIQHIFLKKYNELEIYLK